MSKHSSWGSRTYGELLVCTLMLPDACGMRRLARLKLLRHLREQFPSWEVHGPKLDCLQHAVKNDVVLEKINVLFAELGLGAVVASAMNALQRPKKSCDDVEALSCKPNVFLKRFADSRGEQCFFEEEEAVQEKVVVLEVPEEEEEEVPMSHEEDVEAMLDAFLQTEDGDFDSFVVSRNRALHEDEKECKRFEWFCDQLPPLIHSI